MCLPALTIEPMRLYRSREVPDHWIGEDKHGALMVWPAVSNGWLQRTAYTGGKRQLEEVEPALARGTRWPGAGRARKPRSAGGEVSARRLTLRATDAEVDSWEHRANEEDKAPSVWARDTL